MDIKTRMKHLRWQIKQCTSERNSILLEQRRYKRELRELKERMLEKENAI